MIKSKICPKCEGVMEEGKIIGKNNNWRTNTSKDFLKDSEKEILSYACKKCGYLESYVKN